MHEISVDVAHVSILRVVAQKLLICWENSIHFLKEDSFIFNIR